MIYKVLLKSQLAADDYLRRVSDENIQYQYSIQLHIEVLHLQESIHIEQQSTAKIHAQLFFTLLLSHSANCRHRLDQYQQFKFNSLYAVTANFIDPAAYDYIIVRF